MKRTHTAKIHWSEACERHGLSSRTRAIDPAWFSAPGVGSEEGWSLVCDFDAPASTQGNPSIARVQFMVEEAPHERLVPAATLQLFEPATGSRARVEILD